MIKYYNKELDYKYKLNLNTLYFENACIGKYNYTTLSKFFVQLQIFYTNIYELILKINLIIKFKFRPQIKLV